MKTIRFLILASLLVAINHSIAAQNSSPDKILAKVVSNIESAPSLTINMDVALSAPGNGKGGQRSKAHLIMSRDKFTFKSGMMEVFYDGSTQWTVNKDSKEISLTSPTPSELAESNPLAFIRSYAKSYNATMLSQTNDSYKIKMVAKSKSAYIRSAVVTISRTTMMPTNISATLSSGQMLTVSIASSTKGKGLSLNTFRADTKAYPKYEIIDMR